MSRAIDISALLATGEAQHVRMAEDACLAMLVSSPVEASAMWESLPGASRTHLVTMFTPRTVGRLMAARAMSVLPKYLNGWRKWVAEFTKLLEVAESNHAKLAAHGYFDVDDVRIDNLWSVQASWTVKYLRAHRDYVHQLKQVLRDESLIVVGRLEDLRHRMDEERQELADEVARCDESLNVIRSKTTKAEASAKVVADVRALLRRLVLESLVDNADAIRTSLSFVARRLERFGDAGREPYEPSVLVLVNARLVDDLDAMRDYNGAKDRLAQIWEAIQPNVAELVRSGITIDGRSDRASR